jgi:hypothetical protein
MVDACGVCAMRLLFFCFCFIATPYFLQPLPAPAWVWGPYKFTTSSILMLLPPRLLIDVMDDGTLHM